MLTDPNKFEVHLNGLTYSVVRSATDKNVYKLRSKLGTYVIAKDFYNTWVELTRKTGSPDILINQIGLQIDSNYSDTTVSG